MEGKMKVAVMNGIGKMGYTTRDIPTPKDDEVLVKLEYVGICGSDMHYYETGAIGHYVVEPPFVLGHEPGGTVVEVGKKVTHLKVGDRVALEPGKTCGHCKFCREGKYNLCPDVVFFATPPVDGVFQEYVAHEAALCFKLPDNVSTLEGALIEPLAVGFHAANQGGAHAGQTAVVMGAGCIGLMSMMALKSEGVSHVYVVDIMQARLDKALELGADGVINGKDQNAVQAVLEAGRRVCYIFGKPLFQCGLSVRCEQGRFIVIPLCLQTSCISIAYDGSAVPYPLGEARYAGVQESETGNPCCYFRRRHVCYLIRVNLKQM